MPGQDENRTDPDQSNGQKPQRGKSIGEKVREGSLYSAPTIIIVYPIVGFFVGYIPHKLWNWPIWVALITMILGLVQAIREIYKLGKKIYGDDLD